MRAPSDDDVAMCEFEIDVSPIIWQIFESETRLRNSTAEKTIEDFMERFASRDPLDQAYRVMNSDGMRFWNNIPHTVTLTLTKSTFDAFMQATIEARILPDALVKRFVEQTAFTL